MSGIAYGTGFMAATALLHVAGIGLALGIGKLGEARGKRLVQFAGGAMALTGLAILGGVV